MAEQLVSTGEIARRLGVDPRTVTRWATAGIIAAEYVTPGGQRRYLWSAVQRQLRAAQQRPDP